MLKEFTTIAVDVMSGDVGPEMNIPGALQVLARHQDVHLIMVGDEELLQTRLGGSEFLKQGRMSFQHASQQVAMDELPSHALRAKKDSSMRVALNLVKQGDAQACVSSGNTGALMATARYVLKTLPGIDRPAILTAFPTQHPDKLTRMLDLGANIDSCADNLYQFAVMGSVVASAVDNIRSPKVGLLNIGSEEMKGNDQVKLAGQLLAQNKSINYIGYVEGTDIFKGTVDVVACDGFVGNAALKTMEGLANLVLYCGRRSFKKNLYTRAVSVLAQPILHNVIKRVDPRRHNGASLIGLRGIVIKSHGSADEVAFAHAIEEAVQEVEKNVPQRICEELGAVLEELEEEI